VVQLAHGGLIHIHIAEQSREVEECVAWSGRRPVEWLLDAQAVDERWCLVHATHATPAELAGVASRRAVVGLCPLTEASLGDGIFPAAAFLAQLGRIGIGSDSNILLDAAEELRSLEYSSACSNARATSSPRAPALRPDAACSMQRSPVAARSCRPAPPGRGVRRDWSRERCWMW